MSVCPPSQVNLHLQTYILHSSGKRQRTKCALRNCKSNSATSFHRIPAKEKKRILWLKILGNENLFESQKSRICSNHFSDESFTMKHEKRMLKPNAVPTLNLPECSNSETDTASEDDTFEMEAIAKEEAVSVGVQCNLLKDHVKMKKRIETYDHEMSKMKRLLHQCTKEEDEKDEFTPIEIKRIFKGCKFSKGSKLLN